MLQTLVCRDTVQLLPSGLPHPLYFTSASVLSFFFELFFFLTKLPLPVQVGLTSFPLLLVLPSSNFNWFELTRPILEQSI